jgi:anti-sigma factor RsiW
MTPMSRVVCLSGVDLLADYLEGQLSPEVNASLEQHVLGCERCQAFVASYQATPAILRNATEAVLPEDLRVSLGNWVRKWGSGD